jgi:hypothetical protein
MNQIRIREARKPLPGETVQVWSWANPPAPRPIRDPSAKFVKRQERLNKDAGAFKAAATFAGL